MKSAANPRAPTDQPRTHAERAEDHGLRVWRKRLARLMHYGLCRPDAQSLRAYNGARARKAFAPDLVGRQFAATLRINSGSRTRPTCRRGLAPYLTIVTAPTARGAGPGGFGHDSHSAQYHLYATCQPNFEPGAALWDDGSSHREADKEEPISRRTDGEDPARGGPVVDSRRSPRSTALAT